MIVFVSVDMEGVAGVATIDQIARGGHGYPAAQALMTGEANAAIAGAFDGGASEVIVNDSHGFNDNLLLERLDPRARVVYGAPKGFCMTEGLTEEADLAMFVGYHAPAGTSGVLSHTFSGHFTSVRLNGVEQSEASINAIFAASRRVPVGLVTGDDVICRLAAASFVDVEAIAVKRSHGFLATDTIAPSVARSMIRRGARDAVRRADTVPLVQVPDTLHLELDMPFPGAADLLSAVPGARRTGDRTVEHRLDRIEDVLGMILVGTSLATLSVDALRLARARE